jgi:hypothetical protein
MEGGDFRGAIRNHEQIWLNIGWFMWNFMRSFENIILGIVNCVRVKNFERPFIEIRSHKTQLVALNSNLTESWLFKFEEAILIVLKHSLHAFPIPKVDLSFVEIFALEQVDWVGSFSISSLQVHCWPEVWAILKYVCGAVTEKTKLSINGFIVVKYFLIFHH